MSQIDELVKLFFSELRQYNSTNFRILEKADLTKESAVVHKSCSSVVTRFFIFKEKHPEISEADIKVLYFKLCIDRIARYFAEYPVASLSDLEPFQMELRRYVTQRKTDNMKADSMKAVV